MACEVYINAPKVLGKLVLKYLPGESDILLIA